MANICSIQDPIRSAGSRLAQAPYQKLVDELGHLWFRKAPGDSQHVEIENHRSGVYFNRLLSPFSGKRPLLLDTKQGIGTEEHWGEGPLNGRAQDQVPKPDVQTQGSTAPLCLCPRSGAWAIPHCLPSTAPSWVRRPSWRWMRKCQAPTVCKWLPSLGLGLGHPVALCASF